MTKVFIFANSFAANTIISCFDKVINIECSEIILLKENHSSFEFEKYINKKIILIENLEECIKLCDYVFIFKDEFIPEKSLLLLEKMSKQYQKKYFYLNFDENKNNYNLEKDIYEYKYYEVPVILNIALGVTSQFFTMELILNKILNDKSIYFKQFFSDEMYKYMLWLYNHEFLKSCISDQLFKVTDYSVLIITINIGEELYNLREYSEFIRTISPDYIMLQSSFRPLDYINAHKVVNMFCNSHLDIIINSCYCNLHDKNFIVRCNGKTNDKNIESASIENDLSFDIFSKIALPEGIISY